MDDNKKIISTGWRVGSQTPIDDRLVFNTLAELIDLGASNFEAFRYYEGMKVYVVEEEQEYIWKESSTGVLPASITYPVNIQANGIDYSNRSFNFVEANYSPSLAYVDVETVGELIGPFNISNNSLNALGTDIFPTLQGVTPFLGMKVLVKDQTSQFYNGDYELTRIGDGATEGWILTRISNKTSEFYFRLWKVESTGRIYEQITELPVVNTDNIVFKDLKYLNLGNILYVSENGDNSLAQKGNINYPYATLYAAKTAATSGDLIYVFSQTIVYDNRNSTSNQWNGRQAEIDLWKDGVTYYFEPNCKIEIHNENSAGENLSLFDCRVVSGETCTVEGYLEFYNYGNGPDSSNGKGYFLLSDAATDGGYTFNVELKTLYSDHNDIITIVKSNTAATSINLNINCQEEYFSYSGGNGGAGSMYFIMGAGTDAEVFININTERRYYNYVSIVGFGYPFYIRSTFSDSSIINFTGKYCSNLTKNLIRLREVKHKNINIKIDKILFDRNTATYGNGVITEVFDPSSLSDFVLNIYGDLEEAYENSFGGSLFEMIGPNSVINYKGNIILKTNTGSGKTIVHCANGAFGSGYCSNNSINIEGNIKVEGTTDTTNTLFINFGANNKVIFKGNIEGKFASLTDTKNGSITLFTNSNIESTVTGAELYNNTSTTLSSLSFINTVLKLNSDVNVGADGKYLNVAILNSNIVNLGTNNTLTNSTNNGDLQILNSSIYSNTGDGIEYAGTNSVISSNTLVNTNYTITNLLGEITILTDLIY
jgi:hypothetical protein